MNASALDDLLSATYRRKSTGLGRGTWQKREIEREREWNEEVRVHHRYRGAKFCSCLSSKIELVDITEEYKKKRWY